MHRKKSRTIALGSAAPTSRRTFLRYGGVVIGTSIVASSWPRWAAAQSASFDYYISPSGSDSNPGTQSQPWAITSLRSGSPNRSKMAGHRVGVLPGTYNVIAAVGGSTSNDFSSPVLDV